MPYVIIFVLIAGTKANGRGAREADGGDGRGRPHVPYRVRYFRMGIPV